MNSWPKISIITPVKNGGATLERAIQSLLSQNYPNLEYIIIDGASTDGTLDIIKKYEKNLTYWESEDDKNNVVAHIKGIKKATGDLVAFLNADDFYEPEILQKAACEFQNDSTLDVISFRCRTIEINSSGQRKILDESSAKDMELSKEQMFKIPAPNARFFKRDLFSRFGFQIPKDDQNRTFISNDVEYLTRFILSGIKNKTVDIVGYNYLVHSGSLTFSTDLKTQKRLCEDKIFIAKKFLNSNEFELPKIYKKTFIRWIKKYRAKIVLINFKEKNWAELKENLAVGIKDNGALAFVFYLVKSLFRK